MSNTTIRTYRGGHIDVLDPNPSDITIESIAIGLARQCRYAGQCPVFYSVAEHSWLMAAHIPRLARLSVGLNHARTAFLRGRPPRSRKLTEEEVRKLQLRALLHDASEAYIGDMPGPVKSSDLLEGYRKIESRLQQAIYRRFELELEDEFHDEIVHQLDVDFRHKEMDVLWGRAQTDGDTYVRFRGYGPSDAERLFLAAYDAITNTSKSRFCGFFGETVVGEIPS